MLGKNYDLSKLPKVTVKVDNRIFIIRFADDGDYHDIKERIIRNPGHSFLEGVSDVVRRHRAHDGVPKRGLYKEILDKAAEALKTKSKVL